MCPELEELERFATGKLTGEARSFAEAHVPNCQICRERVAEVRANLQVAQRVAAQAVESSPAAEALRAYQATETDALEPEPRATPSVDIPGYEILRELHRGGQGVVYQAVQQSAKRKVAVKVLREGPYATKSARSRFEREIELVAQLKHANIVAIFDSGTTPDGWHYCAMDYIRGLPFHQHVRENHLTLEQALKIFCEVCDAVQYAHHKGVIHRDLKPSNIMVNSEGKPKILDFGLAKQLIGPVETVVSMTHDIVGTLPYMSPEQAKGNPDHIDTRTDIYALGVVLYEILTGHYPYPVVGHMADVLRNITETPPTPPSRQWTPDSGVTRRSGKHIRAGHCPIDDELQTVILKTLTKERERRYQSAGDLARDIQHYLAGEPIEAKRDSALYVIRKSLRRHKFGATVVALVLVLGLAFAGYAYEQRRFQERQEDLQHLLTEGREFDARGQRLKAVAKYDEALRIAPELYEAVALKAYSLKEQYFEKGFKSPDHSLLRESLQCCDRALQLRPERPGLLNLRCELHRELGDLSAAEESCRQALQADAAYYPASSNLARILAAQYRFDEALQVVRAALPYAVHQAEEGAIQQYDDEFWRTAGTLQLHLQDAQAIDSLRRARDIDRKDARNRLMLARAYLTLPAHLDERQALRCAISAGETRLLENPHYERIEAQAQLVSGQFAEAASSAQRAIQGGDEPAYGHLIWATAEARLGQLEEARKHLQQATTAWPQDFQDGVIVSVEKDLLWFDTLAELEELRRFAEQAIANDSEN